MVHKPEVLFQESLGEYQHLLAIQVVSLIFLTAPGILDNYVYLVQRLIFLKQFAYLNRLRPPDNIETELSG